MFCCLLQQVKYHARGKTRTVRNCLQELRHDKIEGGGKDAWRSEKLFIPPVPPSYLLGCSIIDIRYLAMVRTKCKTWKNDIPPTPFNLMGSSENSPRYMYMYHAQLRMFSIMLT